MDESSERSSCSPSAEYDSLIDSFSEVPLAAISELMMIMK